MWLKICGVQSEENARRLAREPVDALGINRVPSSSRFVDQQRARRLAQVIRRENPDVEIVGVYVDAPAEEVVRDRDATGIDTAQLHGEEPPGQVEELTETMDVIKAFRVDETFTPGVFADYSCHRKLVDAYHPRQHGGTGESAPWHRVREWTGNHRIILAGGITPNNVEEAVRTVKPWGLDVCSGVEDETGRKDLDAVRSLSGTVKGSP